MGNEHNALKFWTSLTRGLKRLTGVDDHEDGTTRLSESLVSIFDIYGRPENPFPLGEKLWGVAVTQGASVGNLSTCGISNPAGSGHLVIVESFHIQAISETFTFRVGANIAFTATGTPTQADLRIPGLPNPSLVTVSFANASAAQIGTTVYQVSLNATNIFDHYEFPVVLPPGFFFGVDRSTANSALTVSFRGRERLAKPGELLAI